MKQYDLMEMIDKMENECYLNAYGIFCLIKGSIACETNMDEVADAYSKLLTRAIANFDVGEMVKEKYGENSEEWIHIHGNGFLCLCLAAKCAERMLDEMEWGKIKNG